MLRRKIVTTLLAIPISLLLIFTIIFDGWKEPVDVIVMTTMFSVVLSPYIILYGVPVTVLSDFIGKRINGKTRIIIAFIVHVMFGTLVGFLFPFHASLSLTSVEADISIISAFVTAIIFWVIDELLRNKKIGETFTTKSCAMFIKKTT